MAATPQQHMEIFFPRGPGKTPSAEHVFNPYWGYVAGGFAFFTAVSTLTRYTVPECAEGNPRTAWKWRNILTSFIHSTITGVWAPLVFYLEPALCDDMIYGFSDAAHALISFSIGYFVFDFFDMWLYDSQGKSTLELLFHHFCVVSCFGIAAHSREYIPYASLALIVEVNSIFLHLRQLMLIRGVPKASTAYRNVALLNMATFVLFRIVLMGWMTRWITVNRDVVPLLFFTAGSVGLAVITFMNILLFYRIIMADFAGGSGSGSAPGTPKVIPGTKISNEAFSPVSKDVKNIMKNFFNDEEVEVEVAGADGKKAGDGVKTRRARAQKID